LIQSDRFKASMPSLCTPCKTALLFGTLIWILFSVSGCQSFRPGSGYNMESKYSLKKRKSYISCIPEGSSSPVARHLPLKVTEQSLEQLFSSIDDHLGTHYRPGGTTPEGFDCSGFVQYLYKQNFRMLLPRTSGEQALLGTMVPKQHLQPGDLVFFSSDGSRIDHVGIFIGENRFAHAATGGIMVNLLLDRYYSLHYACASHLITTE